VDIPGFTIALQQSAKGFTSVTARVSELGLQLTLGPGWLTSGVPFRKQPKRVVIAQAKAAHETATDTKRVQIAVRPFNRRGNPGEVATRSVDGTG
jgi:hypothetical protein